MDIGIKKAMNEEIEMIEKGIENAIINIKEAEQNVLNEEKERKHFLSKLLKLIPIQVVSVSASALVSAFLNTFAKLNFWPAALIGLGIVLGPSLYVGSKASDYLDDLKEAKSNKKMFEKNLSHHKERKQELIDRIELLKNLDLNESIDYLLLDNYQDKKAFIEEKYKTKKALSQDNMKTVKDVVNSIKGKSLKGKNPKGHSMGED